MSFVDNYILINTLLENGPPRLAEVNAVLPSDQKFVSVKEHAGGYKNMGCDVALLAGNFLFLEDVARAIVSAKWSDPEFVQLVHKSHHHDGFTLYAFQDLKRLARS